MSSIAIGLNAVIVAVTAEVPRILTVRRGTASLPGPAGDALPFGPLEPDTDRTLDLGLRRVEQLYTFGDRDRESPAHAGGPRLLSVAYLALVREGEGAVAGEAHWVDAYAFLPWEDWRAGRPEVIDEAIAPTLARWVERGGPGGPRTGAAAAERRERADIAFGLGGAPWDGDRVLERYELLYEAGLPPEAHRDAAARGETVPARTGAAPVASATTATSATSATNAPCAATASSVASVPTATSAPSATTATPATTMPSATSRSLPGLPMAFDHRRILATALGRLRGKLRYRPVVFELLPPTFTLLQLQRVVEALAGVRLHKQNFRRLVETGGLVEGTGRQHPPTGGRPAELFVFRRDVLRERPAPGVGLPGLRRG
jgi:hypothetical protein